jgi:hypothetical protein
MLPEKISPMAHDTGAPVRSDDHRGSTRLLIGVLGVCGAVFLVFAAPETPGDIQVPRPPFTEGVFPCSQCHNPKDMKLNTTRRVLVDAHDDIELRHGQGRWCFDCHDPEKRDSLRLVGGKLIGFDVSYQLCGQCHGEKLRDWKLGIHGKRTGEWDGKKQYLLCVNCHNQHSPRFKPLKPLPAPASPEEIK